MKSNNLENLKLAIRAELEDILVEMHKPKYGYVSYLHPLLAEKHNVSFNCILGRESYGEYVAQFIDPNNQQFCLTNDRRDDKIRNTPGLANAINGASFLFYTIKVAVIDNAKPESNLGKASNELFQFRRNTGRVVRALHAVSLTLGLTGVGCMLISNLPSSPADATFFRTSAILMALSFTFAATTSLLIGWRNKCLATKSCGLNQSIHDLVEGEITTKMLGVINKATHDRT